MTIYEAIKEVRDSWGDDTLTTTYFAEKTLMTFDKFLTYCTCCGGNWGGMLLTGVRRLYPQGWDAIPNDLGINPFKTICALLLLLGVDFGTEEQDEEEQDEEDPATIEFEPGRVYWDEMAANP